MRLSIFGTKRDRKRCRRARVFLNDVEVTRDCQIADTREGWVLVFARSAKGRPIFDQGRGEVLRLRKHGRVRIEFRRRA